MKRLMIAAALVAATPAQANWKLVPIGQAQTVAKSGMTVTAALPWNRSTFRPGKKAETWTRDGTSVDELIFVGAIGEGEPLLRDRDKKNRPLPLFAKSMLLPDVTGLFEQTVRLVLDTTMFETLSSEPTTFGGKPGVRLRYRYVAGDDALERTGEMRAAIAGGQLYMMFWTAPTIHYHAAGVAGAQALMDSARLP